jgi:hypothetical protein
VARILKAERLPVESDGTGHVDLVRTDPLYAELAATQLLATAADEPE